MEWASTKSTPPPHTLETTRKLDKVYKIMVFKKVENR
jgi:hypothetical protein